jgi:hypothetical protein
MTQEAVLKALEAAARGIYVSYCADNNELPLGWDKVLPRARYIYSRDAHAAISAFLRALPGSHDFADAIEAAAKERAP